MNRMLGIYYNPEFKSIRAGPYNPNGINIGKDWYLISLLPATARDVKIKEVTVEFKRDTWKGEATTTIKLVGFEVDGHEYL